VLSWRPPLTHAPAAVSGCSRPTATQTATPQPLTQVLSALMPADMVSTALQGRGGTCVWCVSVLVCGVAQGWRCVVPHLSFAAGLCCREVQEASNQLAHSCTASRVTRRHAAGCLPDAWTSNPKHLLDFGWRGLHDCRAGVLVLLLLLVGRGPCCLHGGGLTRHVAELQHVCNQRLQKQAKRRRVGVCLCLAEWTAKWQ
jgi:hypothetical protein